MWDDRAPFQDIVDCVRMEEANVEFLPKSLHERYRTIRGVSRIAAAIAGGDQNAAIVNYVLKVEPREGGAIKVVERLESFRKEIDGRGLPVTKLSFFYPDAFLGTADEARNVEELARGYFPDAETSLRRVLVVLAPEWDLDGAPIAEVSSTRIVTCPTCSKQYPREPFQQGELPCFREHRSEPSA